MLKIGFLTTLGVNVGDEFIREGIRAILDDLGLAYSPLYVNKHDPATLSRPEEDESLVVADKYWDADLFIQSGAPVYWHLHQGRATSLTSEWHAWMWQERILGTADRPHPVFLNLGAGSCQPWGCNGDIFLHDSGCREFAHNAGRRAVLTTVREDVASRIATHAGVSHERVICPAFLAAARHRVGRTIPGLIGVNLMPLGTHYDLRGDFDRTAWRDRSLALCAMLRKLGQLVFVCHDEIERDHAAGFAAAGERVFFARGWRNYLDLYSVCDVVVANRVHGAVCAAGFGVPSVILGNDTRARIGEYPGLPVFCSATLEPRDVVTCVQGLQAIRLQERRRLLSLRARTLQTYKRLLTPIVAGLPRILDAPTRQRRLMFLPQRARSLARRVLSFPFAIPPGARRVG